MKKRSTRDLYARTYSVCFKQKRLLYSLGLMVNVIPFEFFEIIINERQEKVNK